jgi:beta-lactam-binding protein with PASTA domain
VQVPDVRGTLLAKARQRLLLQPLRTRVEWRPALPGERAGFVIGQTPLKGTLSAYDRVTLIVARGNGRDKKGEPKSP